MAQCGSLSDFTSGFFFRGVVYYSSLRLLLSATLVLL